MATATLLLAYLDPGEPQGTPGWQIGLYVAGGVIVALALIYAVVVLALRRSRG